MDTHQTSSDRFKEIKVKGNQLVDKVREIIESGNARRVVIKKDGKTVLELPLSIGAGAASAAILMQPMLAAVGAVAALITDVTIAVEHADAPAPADADLGTTATPPTSPLVTPGSATGSTPGAPPPPTMPNPNDPSI